MIALTKEKRDDLLAYGIAMIADAKVNGHQIYLPDKYIQLMKIALASLTAAPSGYRWFHEGSSETRGWYADCYPLDDDYLEKCLADKSIHSYESLFTAPPVPEIIDIESDVKNIIQLLSDREWAEHCTSTELGKELESQITDLYNEVSKIKLPKIVSRSEIAGNEAARDWFLRGCDWYEKEIKALYGLGE